MKHVERVLAWAEIDRKIAQMFEDGTNTADIARELVLPQAFVANRLARIRDAGHSQ